MKKLIAASITAAASVALLAGCASTAPDGASSERATPEPTVTSSAAAAPAANVCEDGVITVTDAESAEKVLKEGCDTVYLLTSDVELDLGAVKKLGIEGNGNTVSVASLESVYITGTGNTVQHGGAAPDADNVQDGNTITAE